MLKLLAHRDLQTRNEEGTSLGLRLAAVFVASLLFSFLSALGQQQPCDARAAVIGDTTQASGVVDSSVTRDSSGHWAWFYISESGCRIRVYYDRGDLPLLAQGRRVLVTGQRTEFNDEPQITAYSVGLMARSTASGNRLLVVVLIISGVILSALAVVAIRLRHARKRGDETPISRPDAETSGVCRTLAGPRASRKQLENHEASSSPSQDRGRLLHDREYSRESTATIWLRRIRRKYPRAYDRWSTDEVERLVGLKRSGNGVRQIAKILQRQPGAIRSRLKKLEAGNDPLHVRSHTARSAKAPTTERSRVLHHGEIAFLPLAVSSMKGKAVCVAGFDIKAKRWIRLVRQGTYSLQEAESGAFREHRLSAWLRNRIWLE